MDDITSESSEWLGRYELVRQLGMGGMAEVWLAVEHGPAGSRKQVALKRLLPQLQHDQELIAGLMDEANIAARISHPNVVQIYELGQEGETFFLAMEYLSGVSLSEIQRRARWTGRRLPFQLAALIISQLCSGLEHAHSLVDDDGKPLQIIHRDVSPQNVMVLFDGGVKLLDFGIAKARERMTPMTAAHVIKGKLAYMSPEQIGAQPVDARCDLFACGVVLWELLTGQLVSPEAPPQLGIVASPRDFCSDLPAALEGVVVRALAISPKDRFQSAGEMSRAIETVLERVSAVSNADLAKYVGELFAEDPDTAEVVWSVSQDATDEHSDLMHGPTEEHTDLMREPTDEHSAPNHDAAEEQSALMHEPTALMPELTEQQSVWLRELTQERTAILMKPEVESSPKRSSATAEALDAADTARHQRQPVHEAATELHALRELDPDDDHIDDHDDHQSQLASRLRQGADTLSSHPDGMDVEFHLAATSMTELERSDRQRYARRRSRSSRWILLLVLPAILVAVLVALWPADTPDESIAEISSDPPGAEVFVDGRSRGITPLVLQGLSPGAHHFELVLSTYRRWNDEITLTANERKRVHALLVRRD